MVVLPGVVGLLRVNGGIARVVVGVASLIRHGRSGLPLFHDLEVSCQLLVTQNILCGEEATTVTQHTTPV